MKMKNLLNLTLSVFILTLLFVNFNNSKDNKSEQSFIGNFVALNTANAEGGGPLVNCYCPLLWEGGCYADNWGPSCASGNCSNGYSQC